MKYHLVHDEIEEMVSPRFLGCYLRARVRIFAPADSSDEPVVVLCSELVDNPSASVTNAAEEMATQVRDRYVKGRPMIWIEHYTKFKEETFDLVEFDEGPGGSLCAPRWKHLGRERFEALIGSPLEGDMAALP